MELFSKTLSEISKDIREKKVTIKEVLDSVYNRIDDCVQEQNNLFKSTCHI